MSFDKPASVAQRSLMICPLFESEILTWLALRNWGHPCADDDDYRTGLLENAASVLATASANDCNQVFIAGMPSHDMNLIAALWYAENCALEEPESMANPEQRRSRIEWLDRVKQALPSCFCPADDLTP